MCSRRAKDLVLQLPNAWIADVMMDASPMDQCLTDLKCAIWITDRLLLSGPNSELVPERTSLSDFFFGLLTRVVDSMLLVDHQRKSTDSPIPLFVSLKMAMHKKSSGKCMELTF